MVFDCGEYLHSYFYYKIKCHNTPKTGADRWKGNYQNSGHRIFDIGTHYEFNFLIDFFNFGEYIFDNCIFLNVIKNYGYTIDYK